MEQLDLFPPGPHQTMLPGMADYFFWRTIDLSTLEMQRKLTENLLSPSPLFWWLRKDEPEIDFRHMEVSIPLRPWQLSFDSKFMHYLENRVARGMDDFTLHLARLIYGQEE